MNVDTNNKASLSNVPFITLKSIQQKAGLKNFQKYISGDAHSTQKLYKRTSSKRPLEASSKVPPKTIRNNCKNREQRRIDPRFNRKFGEYNFNQFRKSYAFLNDIREKDIEVLKAALSQTSDEAEMRIIKKNIQRLRHQIEYHKYADEKEKADKETKAKLMEVATDAGDYVPFLTKSEKRQITLANKFKELKEKNKVDVYLARRRRKLANKLKKKFRT